MPLLVCVVPVSPIRAEASHRSEQVSQLLFGERCEEQERVKDFVKVRVLYDGYEGWCQESQLEETTPNEALTESKLLAAEWVNRILVNKKVMHIPFGSPIPGNGCIASRKVEYKGLTIDVEKNCMNEEMLQKLSSIFLNTSYLWGGRSVFGIDCSGFTQLVFKCFNIPLLRDASQQVTQGDEVGFLQEAKYGDLAFFDNEAGKITHVGIFLNANTIVHASGKVRVDAIDSVGIINGDTGKRTHNLRLIKRVFKQPANWVF
ncbi:MAG: NlpC/P60 family protein [Segetibacter sp.]